MNVNEMKATLHMVLARLESEPTSVVEWAIIKKHLGAAHRAAGEELRCANIAEKSRAKALASTWDYVAVGCEGQRVTGEVVAATKEQARQRVKEFHDESLRFISLDRR